MNTIDKDPMTAEPWMYKDEWLRGAAHSADIARGLEREAIGLAWDKKRPMTVYGPACEAFARWVHSAACALYAFTPPK